MLPLGERLPVVFVGSFRNKTDDGGVGGQMYACRSLVESGISKYVRWLCIDSTMASIPPPSLFRRGLAGVRRLLKLLQLLAREPQAAVLVFAGDGPSFLEKGVMMLAAHSAGHRAVLCPRSGILVDDLDRSAFFRWFVPLVANRSTAVMCQGRRWVDFFTKVRGVRPERLRMVPNWIRCEDYEAVFACREPRKEVRTFLYMGWLEDYKGIFDLIEAVDRRRVELAQARFVICGSGSRASETQDRVSAARLSDRFEFRGWVRGDEKLRALRDADVLVLPSRREGMPNIVLEAMACGLPVVAADVGAVAELVQSGLTGLLVPPANTIELGDALVQCLRDPLAVQAWGVAARAHVREKHDVRVLWPAVLGVLTGERVCREKLM